MCVYGSLRSACAGRKGGRSEFARASSPDVTDTHIEPCEAAQHAVSHGNLSAESRPRAGGAYSQRTGAPSRPGRFAGPYASGAVRGLPESSAGDINGDVDVCNGPSAILGRFLRQEAETRQQEKVLVRRRASEGPPRGKYMVRAVH